MVKVVQDSTGRSLVSDLNQGYGNRALAIRSRDLRGGRGSSWRTVRSRAAVPRNNRQVLFVLQTGAARAPFTLDRLGVPRCGVPLFWVSRLGNLFDHDRLHRCTPPPPPLTTRTSPRERRAPCLSRGLCRRAVARAIANRCVGARVVRERLVHFSLLYAAVSLPLFFSRRFFSLIYIF